MQVGALIIATTTRAKQSGNEVRVMRGSKTLIGIERRVMGGALSTTEDSGRKYGDSLKARAKQLSVLEVALT